MTEHLIVVLKITLVVFIAGSLLDMGLRLDPPDAARGLRNVRFVGLTAHSGNHERSIRSIMNTEPGDHEHALAVILKCLDERRSASVGRYH